MFGLEVLSLNAGANFLCKEGNIMVKKLLLCVVLVTAMVSAANAEMYFWSRHLSVAELTDGHPDYSSARFHDIGIELSLIHI